MAKIELQEKRMLLQSDLNNLIRNAETEKRELNDEENAKIVDIRSQIDNIDEEIRKIDEENEKLAKLNNQNKNTNRQMEKTNDMSLVKVIRGMLNGNLTDEQRSAVKGNTIDYRTLQATTDTKGKEDVETEIKGLDLAIRNASVLSEIGATWFSNAVGDIALPRYGGSNVKWAGEGEAAQSGDTGFDEVTLTPHRITGYIDISRQLLLQAEERDIEALLIRDIADAVAEHIDATLFSNESGDTKTPEGLFHAASAETGVTMSALTFGDVLDLENAVEKKNGKNYIFITEPTLKNTFRGVQTASGLEMVYNNGELDGRKTVVSNSVVDGGLMAVDPKDIAAAMWGNLKITVDDLSRAIYDETRITVSAYVDCKFKGNRYAAMICA